MAYFKSLRTIFAVLIGFLLTIVVSFANISVDQTVNATEHRVEISGFKFIPKELQLSVGDRVTWVNKDIVPHNIALGENQKAISADFLSGEEFTLVIEKSMQYLCGLHPSMTGNIIIRP